MTRNTGGSYIFEVELIYALNFTEFFIPTNALLYTRVIQ